MPPSWRRWPPRCLPMRRMVALVDESAFIRRFGAASDRLADRRATWQRILASRVDIEPLFVSLEADDLGEARAPAGGGSR